MMNMLIEATNRSDTPFINKFGVLVLKLCVGKFDIGYPWVEIHQLYVFVGCSSSTNGHQIIRRYFLVN